MTATIAAPHRPHAHPKALGWIPPSEFSWLEELREEHGRLVVARGRAAEAATELGRRQVALRAEYDEAVAEAARADADPPPFPGRLDSRYMEIQAASAREAEAQAAAALDGWSCGCSTRSASTA